MTAWVLIVGLVVGGNTVIQVFIPMESEAACLAAAENLSVTRRGNDTADWLGQVCERRGDKEDAR